MTPGTPALPIVSDASVEILSGRAEFLNRRAVLRAADGSLGRLLGIRWVFIFERRPAAGDEPSPLADTGRDD